MLIEFSVSNFRSIREKQTFSMVAASRLAKKNNVFTPDVKGEKLPPLLKVAAIYGPNASGKSNLIAALSLIVDLCRDKPSAQSKKLPVSPFRFDPVLINQPSYFEVHFITAGQRYEFNLSLTADRIVEERLTVFPKGKETLLYSRKHTSSGDEYIFGSLEGGDTLHGAWKLLTSQRVLFISQAVANSSEELDQLRKPYQWLSNNLNSVPRNMSSLATIVQSLAKRYPHMASELSSFLQEIDIPVTDVQFEVDEQSHSSALVNHLKIDSENDSEELRTLIDSIDNIKTTLTHRTALGDAKFDFSEESEGTKNLIGFSLPWTILRSASDVNIMVVDELDSSLHPKIVAKLIEKHISFDKPIQLIFTTHDTHLMDTKLLRRDQFWVTERDANGATKLYSFHDFEGRDSEDIEKRYYEGRYRGLPILN